MTTDPRLAQILDFLLLIDRFKTIERKGYIADGSRRETDAEHTWHMGLFALLLHRELGFEVDLGHTLALILVHDLVEIYAGDTYVYDDVGAVGQAEREIAAAERLFAGLPPDPRNQDACLVAGVRGGQDSGGPFRQGDRPDAGLCAELQFGRAGVARKRHHARADLSANRTAERGRYGVAGGH